MPNNLTDAEIKEALECLAHCKECSETEDCQYYIDNGNMCDNISLARDTIDLINRYEKEIKEYEKVVGKLGRKDGKVICVLKGKETEYIPMNIANVYKKLAISKAKAEVLKEAAKKFAGHSDYHGDTILCTLICMAEGKEVGNAKPLDKAEIKAEAYKEAFEKLKEKKRTMLDYDEAGFSSKITVVSIEDIDNLSKDFVGKAYDSTTTDN